MAYDWQRRWIFVYESRADDTDVASRAKAPQAHWQLQSATDGVLFGEIRHIPCLILLGEPGIGKTYAVRREQQELDTRIGNTANRTLWVDLSGCSSVESVRSELFERDNYRDWKAGAHRLTMFVDSVDEAGVPVGHVVTAIGNELADAELNRLQMRIVCRDYAWSLTLAEALEHVWRSHGGTVEKVAVLQLAPLSLNDIRLAAEANSGAISDPESFLNELEAADALPLAMVPITLDMMLKEPGYLTSSRTELYEYGSKRLIRGDRDLTSTEVDKRFAIACRIAASMVFGRKDAVDVIAPVVHEASELLAVRDLLPDGACHSDERHIRETLDSSLFQGSIKRTWRHLSYAEFLAAQYLNDESISVSEILEVTVAPDGMFPPNLHDCLRWLIELRKDILPEIISRQPLVVLAGDLSHLSDSEFEKLFATLLNLPDPRVYRREAWNLRNFRAGHPSARRLLVPYLADTSGSPYLRHFVLRLMRQLDVSDIDDVLARIALNANEDDALRHSAAHRICEVGQVEAKLQLKPYIHGKDDDPDDELKGCALQALWPDHLTADELFGALSPPKRENLVGSYRVFLFEGSVVNKLQPVDLPTALRWVAAQPTRFEMSRILNDLPSAIMRKAWENIHIQGVMETFAETAVAMMMRFDRGLFSEAPYSYPPDKALDSFERDFVANAERRRELALRCLPHLLGVESSAFRLIQCWPPIVVADDLDWLLGLLDSEADEVRREQLAQLVAAIFPQLGSQGATLSERYRDIEKVYEARERHPELKERTEGYFIRMLDDSEAASDRKHHRALKEIEEKRKRQHAKVRPFERLEEALNGLETGEIWQWHNVIHALSHWPDGRSDMWDINPDLTSFPLWKSCAEDTRARIVRAARTVALVEQDEVSASDVKEDWYDSNRVPYVELHGYMAICLLRRADTNAFEQLPPDRWKRWAKIIIWYSSFTIVGDGSDDSRVQIRSLQKNLLSRLHESAPYAYLENLRSHICATDRCGDSVEPLLNGVAHVWNSRIESMCLGLFLDASLSPGTQRSILDFLWSNRCHEALRVAQAKISAGYTTDEEKDLVVECSAFLMTCRAEFDWSAVWKLFQNDDDIGRTIVARVAQEDWHAVKIGAALRAQELADLYIWVEERYPTSHDPNRDGAAGIVTEEQAVNWWRSGIITQLRKKESSEALDGIRRILSCFPELEWLQSVRLDLEKAIEGSDWQPAMPQVVAGLSERREELPVNHLQASARWIIRDKRWLVGLVVVIALGALQFFAKEVRTFLGLDHLQSAVVTQSAVNEQALNAMDDIQPLESREATSDQLTPGMAQEGEAEATSTPLLRGATAQGSESTVPPTPSAES